MSNKDRRIKDNKVGMASRYAEAVFSGKSKKDAKEEAGYSPNMSTSAIEDTKTFQYLLEKHLMKIKEAFEEHRKNIVQDGDKKAKNTALDMYYRLRNSYPKEVNPIEGEFELIIRNKKNA